MNIEFRLVDFHQKTGSLQISYFNENIPDGVLFSINIPIVEGAYLQGDALVSLINSYAPLDIFERAATIKTNSLGSPVPGVGDAPAPAELVPEPLLFGDRQLFVVEDHERVLFVRPLAQVKALDIPVEII